MIWIAHANHSVMLASAAIVQPVPVTTVTRSGATDGGDERVEIVDRQAGARGRARRGPRRDRGAQRVEAIDVARRVVVVDTVVEQRPHDVREQRGVGAGADREVARGEPRGFRCAAGRRPTARARGRCAAATRPGRPPSRHGRARSPGSSRSTR